MVDREREGAVEEGAEAPRLVMEQVNEVVAACVGRNGHCTLNEGCAWGQEEELGAATRENGGGGRLGNGKAS